MVRIQSRIKDQIDVLTRIMGDEHLSEPCRTPHARSSCRFEMEARLSFAATAAAADAQHLAAELSGRFYYDRDPLFAEALHVNTSYLTAVANDYSFDQVFARMVKAAGRKGDVLVGLSTSGNSPNIINAIDYANSIGMVTIGLTGETGGRMAERCTYTMEVPSRDTPRIQESHILLGHILCEFVEQELFPQKNPARPE